MTGKIVFPLEGSLLISSRIKCLTRLSKSSKYSLETIENL